MQTCCFALDGIAPGDAEVTAWLALVAQARDCIAGVHLYGLARASQQAEAPRLTRLPAEWLDALAQRVREQGLTVTASP